MKKKDRLTSGLFCKSMYRRYFVHTAIYFIHGFPIYIDISNKKRSIERSHMVTLVVNSSIHSRMFSEYRPDTIIQATSYNRTAASLIIAYNLHHRQSINSCS